MLERTTDPVKRSGLDSKPFHKGLLVASKSYERVDSAEANDPFLRLHGRISQLWGANIIRLKHELPRSAWDVAPAA
jgi:hypothetical protein